MMIRLMWKEFREKRKWAVALAIFSIAIVLLGWGQTYIGSPRTFTLWTWLLIPAVVVFLSQGAPTWLSGTDFLESRPISIFGYVLSRLLTDILLIVAVGVVTTLAYAAFHPPQYSSYLTAERLLIGTGYTVLAMAIPLLVLLPVGAMSATRFAGGLVLLPPIGLLLLRRYSYGSMYVTGGMEVVWILCSVAVSSVLLAYGRKWDTQERFTISMAALTLVVGSHGLVPGPLLGTVPAKYTWSTVSPDCRYAIVQSLSEGSQDYRPHRSHIIQLSDGRSTTAQWPRGGFGEDTFWTKNHTAFTVAGNTLYTIRLKGEDAPQTRSFRIGMTRTERSLPSPNRDYVLVSFPDGRKHALRVLQVEPAQMLNVRIAGAKTFWWQSNTEVGYKDSKGKRHIVRVVPLSR